ncbi:MAG: nucleotidyltransferase family protein [Hominenteromicrobium sp.]
MKQQDELFLQALAAALKHEKTAWETALSVQDWLGLFERAEMHHVLPMIYEAVYDCPAARGLDPAFLLPFKRRTIQQVTMQAVKTGAFLQLYKHLLKSGIRPLVVKGIVCRSLYPDPDARISGDEDVWVEPEQFAACHAALLAFGMQPAQPEKDLETVYEAAYGKPGSPLYIELHKSLFPPDSDAYGDLNRFFEGAHDRALPFTVQGTEIFTLNSTDHLFYLICHAFKHFLHSGFGIRQVCDIALFADAYGDEIDWLRLLAQCTEIHAEKFTAALFRIGEKYLGFSPTRACQPPQWTEIAVDEAALLEDLLAGGVYGAADRNRLHSSTITLNAVTAQKQGGKAKRSVLKTIFPSAKALSGRYPYLKKYPFLLPAAWGDRLLKYRKETAAGNGAAESIKIGSRRIELMKQYGILRK